MMVGDARSSKDILRLLHQAIRRDIHFIARHPTTLFQCLWNSGWWYDTPRAARHYRSKRGPWNQSGEKLSSLLERWRAEKQQATPAARWLKALRPPAVPLGSAELAVLRGHEGAVLSVAVTADGRQVVSGSDDRTVRVWDLESGAERTALRGHEARVSSVAIAPDGRRVVSGSWDRTVRVWDRETGEEHQVLRGHEGAVTSVAVALDGRRIVSGSEDGTVRVWDLETGAGLRTLRGQGGPLWSVVVTPDGRRIISGSARGTVCVWNSEAGVEPVVLPGGHSDRITGLAVASDGRWLVSSSRDSSIGVWDLESGAGRILWVADYHDSPVLDLLEFRMVEHGQRGAIWSVALTRDGRVVSGSEGVVRLVDSENGAELSVLLGHEGDVMSVAVTTDGRRLVSGGRDHTVRVWTLDTGAERRELLEHDRLVRTLAFTPDGRRLVSGGETVRVWDLETGMGLAVIPQNHVDSLAITPDGRRLACGSGDGKVYLWDLERWTAASWFRRMRSRLRALLRAKPKVFPGHEAGVASLAIAPDGRRVVSGGFDSVRVWDVTTDAEHGVLREPEAAVSSVAISPDGRAIVTGNSLGTVRVWSLETRAERAVLLGHEPIDVTGVAAAPDGRRVVSTGWDWTTRVWDIHSGDCLEVIQGRADVHAIAVGPPRYRFRALAREQETVIEDVETATAVAWYPATLYYVTTSSTGRIWAGPVAGHLHIFTLEGEA